MKAKLDMVSILGPGSAGILKAMAAGQQFLRSQSTGQLLARVGGVIEAVPPFEPLDKSPLQDSYGGAQKGPSDDLLVGRGLFYITEQRRLMLDCTAGHYQMVWGYDNEPLQAALDEAVAAGFVWDNHTNIPQTPVKRLARVLLNLANPPHAADPLDTVLLGCCTGSVACAAAIKIQLLVHQQRTGGAEAPVMVMLNGNYHGTDIVAQHLRGMWPQFVRNIEVATVEPNDAAELSAVFAKYGKRIAGFWAEPIMMNREAIVVQKEYLQLARRLCDGVGALMAIDEIQTGFWQGEVFLYRSLDILPDLVITGKGMTAGFHPQAAVIFRSRHDVLAQYDAISTNGSASLPCYAALCCIEMIRNQADNIVAVGDHYHDAMAALAGKFPRIIRDCRGKRHMAALKFHDRQAALDFHRRCNESGLWVRAHAYHEGHSTVLTKLGLLADEAVADFVVGKFRALLKTN